MAKYTVQNPEGKKVTFEWSHSAPPTDADMEEVFAAAGHSSPPNPSASHGATGSWDEPKSNLRDDVTFLGSEKLGKIASGLFPRTAEAVATGKPYANQVLGAGLDQLSAGRLVAAAPEALKGGDAYLESVGDTEGKNWVGQTLRDPATGLALLTAPLAGFTGGLAKGAVRGGAGLVSRLAGGAAAGARGYRRGRPADVRNGRPDQPGGAVACRSPGAHGARARIAIDRDAVGVPDDPVDSAVLQCLGLEHVADPPAALPAAASEKR